MTSQLEKCGRIMRIIAIIIILSILLLITLRFITQKIIFHNAVKNMEISEIQEIKLNGISQKILIEGKTNNLPIMIMVHGGPGLPIPFGVGFRGQFPQLSEKFILVQWDQYGVGINYAEEIPKIDDYVSMLHDLIIQMKDKFPDRKIFLYGMSWGTILNTKIANQIPNQIDGVIAYGQFTNIFMWKQAMYDTLQAAELTTKEKERLEKAFIDNSTDGFKTIRNMASSKTNLYYYKGKEASNWDFGMHAFHVLISPDYSLSDAIHAYSNPSGDLLMYNDVMNVDMKKDHQLISVPFLILQGEDDLTNSITYNKSLVETNEHISLLVFKNAGHIPTNKSYEEMFRAIDLFTKKIMQK